MRRLLKICTVVFIALFIFLGNVKAKDEFKKKVEPILEATDQPFKQMGDSLYKMTYCNDNDCGPVYIGFDSYSDDEYGQYVTCYSFLYYDYTTTIPSKSIIQKVNDLNADCRFGRVRIGIYSNYFAVYYQNFIWFDGLIPDNLIKNIYLSYSYCVSYKKELEIFKE